VMTSSFIIIIPSPLYYSFSFPLSHFCSSHVTI
jgi:hypothetical protein